MRIEAIVSRDATLIEVRSTGSLLDLPREQLMGIVTRLVGNALAEREGVPSPALDAPDVVDLDGDALHAEVADMLADALTRDEARTPPPEPEPVAPPVNLADPDDVRREALRLLDDGVLSHEAICAQLRIGPRLLQRWDDEAAHPPALTP